MKRMLTQGQVVKRHIEGLGVLIDKGFEWKMKDGTTLHFPCVDGERGSARFKRDNETDSLNGWVKTPTMAKQSFNIPSAEWRALCEGRQKEQLSLEPVVPEQSIPKRRRFRSYDGGVVAVKVSKAMWKTLPALEEDMQMSRSTIVRDALHALLKDRGLL